MAGGSQDLQYSLWLQQPSGAGTVKSLLYVRRPIDGRPGIWEVATASNLSRRWQVRSEGLTESAVRAGRRAVGVFDPVDEADPLPVYPIVHLLRLSGIVVRRGVEVRQIEIDKGNWNMQPTTERNEQFEYGMFAQAKHKPDGRPGFREVRLLWTRRNLHSGERSAAFYKGGSVGRWVETHVVDLSDWIALDAATVDLEPKDIGDISKGPKATKSELLKAMTAAIERYEADRGSVGTAKRTKKEQEIVVAKRYREHTSRPTAVSEAPRSSVAAEYYEQFHGRILATVEPRPWGSTFAFYVVTGRLNAGEDLAVVPVDRRTNTADVERERLMTAANFIRTARGVVEPALDVNHFNANLRPYADAMDDMEAQLRAVRPANHELLRVLADVSGFDTLSSDDGLAIAL